MADSSLNHRQGSNAGRGFRYQDAITAWLAVRVWACVDASAIIIPEGDDDVERRTGKSSILVQVKSRREHLGAVPVRLVANYIKALWEQHDKMAAEPSALELIVEREIHNFAADTDEWTPMVSPLADKLPGGDRGRKLGAKTTVAHVPAPRESSIKLIVGRTRCSDLAAQICFAKLLTRVGELADSNGRLQPADYKGMSSSDTNHEIMSTLSAVDHKQIERALKEGSCEPVDFLTPLNDPDFFLGVDVQPGHVAAGLVLSLTGPRQALERGLRTCGAALVVGPSGSGKSAVMWDTAHALRHTVSWYRLLRLDPRDIPALQQLLRTFRATPDSPVGFVVDDVGRRGTGVWDVLTRELAAIPGALLLGSIREEDVFLLEARARASEVRIEPDEKLAQRLYDELRKTRQTEWAGWHEPWNLSQGLVLEYVHILSKGRRFQETLKDQVNARQRDLKRAMELSVLRVVALAGAAGVAIDAARLAQSLGATDDEVSRSLRRLVEEHLVRKGDEGHFTGLHQLRSAELARLTHDVPPPTIDVTFGHAVNSVVTAGLESLVADAITTRRVSLQSALDVLATRLRCERNIDVLSAMLRGLGAAHIATAVDHWVDLPSVKALAASHVSIVALLGLTNQPISNDKLPRQVTLAAAELTAIRSNFDGDPRRMLLDIVPADTIASMITDVGDAAALDRFLSAQIGIPLHDSVATALHGSHDKLLDDRLDAVADMLGTLAELDQPYAVAWVDEIGEENLLSRLPQEIPWTSTPRIEDANDGRVVRCDYHYIGDACQHVPHDDVVRICQIVLALSPRSDIAGSTARAPNGEVAGCSTAPLADKRIPRANLSTTSLPAWNRRWYHAITTRIASRSYSEYLSSAASMLERLTPALERVLDALLRDRKVPKSQVEALEAVCDEARSLTPPSISEAEAAGESLIDGNRHITKLPNLLCDSSSTVIQRFRNLPDGTAAYVAWLGKLASDVDKARSDELWYLVGGVPDSLMRLRTNLVALREIVGEAGGAKEMRPAVRWGGVARKAGKGNALRLLGSTATAEASRARDRRAIDLCKALTAAQICADIRVLENENGNLPWPPCEVVALVALEGFADLETLAQAGAILRYILPTAVRVTVMPSIDDWAIPDDCFSGYNTLVPTPDDGLRWARRLNLLPFRSTLSISFDKSAALAMSLQTMDRLSLGVTGRPAAEIDAYENGRRTLAGT